MSFAAPASRSLSSSEDEGEGITLRETYRLLRPLGRGGMSVVYEALHLRLGHTVAVKLLARSLATDRQALTRFRREAELLVTLRHPNVVHVVDFDATPEGEPYIVMERLEGESLADRLDRERAISLDSTVGIIEQLASALAHAHSRGILHRDIKPNNVFLENVSGDEPHAKLLDFGIAKHLLAERGITLDCMVGTPEYMAPEQATPWAEIDHRADQYALALLAFEMLSGQHPFWDGEDVSWLLHRVRHQTRKRLLELAPEVPDAVAAVIERGMAKAPEDRYPDVLELARALRLASRGSERKPLHSGVRLTVPKSFSLDTRELARQLETSLAIGDVEAAFRQAELACTALCPATLDPISSVLERALYARLGGPEGRVRRRSPNDVSPHSDVTPSDAFVLSRVDDGMALEDLLDVSALPRREALRSIARLFERGLIALI